METRRRPPYKIYNISWGSAGADIRSWYFNFDRSLVLFDFEIVEERAVTQDI